MKRKILSMCSSWSRPASLLQMVESFQESEAINAELAVYISENDPEIIKYVDLYNSRLKGTENLTVVFGPHRYMVEVLNFFSLTMFPGYEYYQEVNDDHVYRTKQWDVAFVDALKDTKNTGLACGNDLFGNEENEEDEHWECWHHASAAMVSGNVVRALNCFNPPGLRQIGGDIYFKSLFKSAGLMFRLPNVIIEHVSVSAGKAPHDDRQVQVYSEEERKNGRKVLYNWIDKDALKHINICRNLAGLPPTNTVIPLDYL